MKFRPFVVTVQALKPEDHGLHTNFANKMSLHDDEDLLVASGQVNIRNVHNLEIIKSTQDGKFRYTKFMGEATITGVSYLDFL